MSAEALIGVITVSDTRTVDDDRSGPSAVAALRLLGFETFETVIVTDEIDKIQAAILDMSDRCQAIFTTGGTGFSPRDVTPEATAPLLDRRADSLAELMRADGLRHTPFSHLSRGIAGIRARTLVVNLPGSPAGARQGIEAIAHLIPPILQALHA